MTAVRQNGVAQYASVELKTDREVVLVAVRKSREAFHHASDAMQADREMVLAASQRLFWGR